MKHSSALLAALLLPLLAACGGTPPADEEPVVDAGPLVVWSAIDEATLAPFVDSFRQVSAGAAVGDGEVAEAEAGGVEVRYGDGEELAAELTAGAGAMATTDTPRPDLFLADALTLGALADAGLLRPLPTEVTAAVPAHFASSEAHWVGLTGRSREVVYDPERVVPENLPQSLSALGEPRFRGSFALAPGDRALVAHLAVYRALNGAAALQELLGRVAANQPLLVGDDAAVVEAVAAGEAAWGLAGSDALCRHRAGAEEGAPGLGTFHMPSGDASGFVGLSGAGVLSDHPRAVALVAHLLTADAQARLVAATCSYPLVEGIEPPPGQPPLAELDAPQIDFGEVAAVRQATREALAAGQLAP